MLCCVLSCVTLCDPMDSILPGSFVHRIFQEESWNRLPFPTPGDLPDPRLKPTSLESLELAGGFFTTVSPRKPNSEVFKKD